ncbi:MAG: glycosyltransferase [Bryobacteraceae bacterium]|nr:glycosyltransferase [Bryobacteraceae bacterium]
MAAPTPILLFVRELHQGGCERDLTKLALHLDRSRFQPHVGCFYGDGLRASELRDGGLPPVEFPVHSFRSPALLPHAFALRRYVQKHRIRLVQSFDVPASVFVTPVVAGAAPVVLTSQLSYRSLVSRPLQWLLRASDRMATGVVVNCEAMRRHMIEEGVAPHRVHVCCNGIDTGVFHPGSGQRRAEVHGASLVIGTVAALRPEKGLATLLEAFAAARLEDARLVIIGSGPILPTLQAHAAALGLAASTLFIAATTEVADWLRSIDIFVLPSRSEALSNALMEAMACGCTPVASNVGGNPELVESGQNGLLFPVGDADALRSNLVILAGDPNLRHEWGTRSAARIREQYSLGAYVRRMEGLYGDLLAAHDTGRA